MASGEELYFVLAIFYPSVLETAFDIKCMGFDGISTSVCSRLLFVTNFCCEGQKSHLCAFFLSYNLLLCYKAVLLFGIKQFAPVIF